MEKREKDFLQQHVVTRSNQYQLSDHILMVDMILLENTQF
jgi:hypothetical protein